MSILAVIPARAGSKGIPNKNIRLVGGRPLVYYAIRNALDSEFVTNVVVTTDSPEVRIIAQQMGARVHWREAALCTDDVALDAVVADAAFEGAWDWVVTMQPTSPTLTTATLDSAIRRAIDEDFDTLISVVNDPRLSWGENAEGGISPNYAERLNRQWLPADYAETGAFVISRASVVTPQTRIGEKVGVFEVPSGEGIDVDTFDDLRCATARLRRESVAIYVNGNNMRGIGHIYRALEMADEFYSKPDIYYDVNQTDPIVFGRTAHELIGVDGIADLFERCRNKDYTLFVNDILSTSIDYMIGLRSVVPGAKIVNFEDDGEGALKADLVFNALYHDDELPHVKAGERYYISSKTFLFYHPIEIKQRVERVFVSFGGADPQNYSDRLLAIVAGDDKYEDVDFTVVLGRAKHNVDGLLEYNSLPNIEVLYDMANMPELMSACDVAVTSRGRTGYELALMGIPSIAMAQNKREEKHGFVCNENGFTYLGLNPPDEILKSNLDMYLTLSREARQRFQDMLLSHDLRNGRRRVMGLINSL
ncbi:cytidylyltransferase domain-containing protein [Gordonibacter urolithinfaciens]|uniref:cytidylyltransferase domain-containing protein n=1 Tax=Gordonibacter urolithinfaciens TaxID=1335613 RepID=UPI0036F315E0